MEKIEENDLSFPEPAVLLSRKKCVPHVILGDDAFTLHDNMMKPYADLQKKGSLERICNYGLSRAQRVVENAFGIVCVVFRVLRKAMLIEPNKAALVVLTTLYLHNFLRQSAYVIFIVSRMGNYSLHLFNLIWITVFALFSN